MLSRLLYAAVALCLLGTRPEHAPARPAPPLGTAPAAGGAPASARGGGAQGAIGGAPPDFAIPRIQR
jgi:hypothetical protein